MIVSDENIIDRNDKVISEYKKKFKKTNQPIEVKFRDLIPELNKTERFTHLIHSYPAKLLLHIPYFFLNNTLLSKEGDSVLDPFSGTGTVYLETILSGRIAYGADSNPLARLIIKVKSTQYNVSDLEKNIEKIIIAARKSRKKHLPEVRNCDFWFPQKTIFDLSRLLYQINRIDDIEIKNFMLVSFSNCVKKVSYADPRISVPVKINPEKYLENSKLRLKAKKKLDEINTMDVFSKFEKITYENIKRFENLESLHLKQSCTKHISSDSRRLLKNENDLLDDNSIQLILTSPPYAGAQKYIRSSSLNLGWLGLSSVSGLRELDRLNIGRENYKKYEKKIGKTEILEADKIIDKISKVSVERANIAFQYLQEMKISINEMVRVLKKNGFIVLVIGNNTICKMEFNTQDYLTSYIESLGLKLEFKLIDSINSYGLMTKRNKTANIISREYILVFKK